MFTMRAGSGACTSRQRSPSKITNQDTYIKGPFETTKLFMLMCVVFIHVIICSCVHTSTADITHALKKGHLRTWKRLLPRAVHVAVCSMNARDSMARSCLCMLTAIPESGRVITKGEDHGLLEREKYCFLKKNAMNFNAWRRLDRSVAHARERAGVQ